MAFTVAAIGKLKIDDQEGLPQCEAIKERFLVVTRLTVGGGYLVLADAGPASASLPFPAHPRAIILGALNWVDESGRQRFSMKTSIPENIEFSAPFLPASGWLSLWISKGVPEIEGRLTLRSSACDHQTTSPYITCSISGRYFPWEGELLSPEEGFGLQ
ncbi:hypothetical protein [Poseidonocella sedimentorum]|uniref:Uncharacterized protein n=1 Tax=Poseidonocella sedimentorum TaxID=871652 RepID=A0A1I6DLI3_9RHOB|nr:hypothetical protein [Poseidonocella sedimentorum]SFR06266.1 hypothetical protein SAMN04515673_10466 [Poseidonocella sedimentorum]